MQDLETFRLETRQWLQENCPKSMRSPWTRETAVWGGRKLEFTSEDQRLWFERMRDKGWFVPDWPKEYGGAGLSRMETEVLREEMRRLNCRPPQQNLGVWMVGPAILEFGNEEQKQKFLPPIARGEIRWCQGYSEPGAGSDLAGLQCRAVRDGDDFIINGSKIWTSFADKSDYIYCLVRTNTEVAKQAGISFIVFDMELEGVSTKPITLLSGENHFCQTFFDNVRVPADHVIGGVDKGWPVAKRVLEFERAMMADMEKNSAKREDPIDMARLYADWDENGQMAKKDLRQRVARNMMNMEIFDLTTRRAMEEIETQMPFAGMCGVIFKYCGTEEAKRKQQLCMDIAGEQALGWEGEQYSEQEKQLNRDWLLSYTHTIAGGTSEIQLNIIAKRVLGLPEQ